MQFLRKKNYALFLLAAMFVAVALLATACGGKGQEVEAKDTIIFAEGDWPSVQLHNQIAGLIIREGYGYKTDFMPGSEQASLIGVSTGDIDVHMEVWTGNNIDKYNEFKDNGDIIELALNFDDNKQGLYVPTYVIKGDPKRGIKPMAPDLKYIHDLPKYWELFKDPEDPNKGRIYGSIPGWTADEVLQAKHENYGLNKQYNYFKPGSGTTLATSLTDAIKEGKPWVGYYWEPTWITGKYDLILLEDAPYSDEKWKGYLCEFPSQRLTIVVQNKLPEQAPEVTAFLENYHTNSALVSETLAYMENNGATLEETAKWFLTEHEEIWIDWVSGEVAEKVKASLN